MWCQHEKTAESIRIRFASNHIDLSLPTTLQHRTPSFTSSTFSTFSFAVVHCRGKKQANPKERDSERKKKRLYTRGNGQVETHIHLSSHLIFAKIIQAFNTPFLKRPLKQAARERGSKRDFQTQHATGELICEVCG